VASVSAGAEGGAAAGPGANRAGFRFGHTHAYERPRSFVMIESVAFASCYVYSPTGDSAICARSRLLRALLKEGDARFMIKYAVRVRQQLEPASRLAGFFRSDDLLVPVPRSAPKVAGTWAAAELARALVQEGVGGATWPGLRRISAVPKSATAATGRRPSVARHFDSFQMEPSALCLRNVVLIDDVITRGRTLLAAAARVREAFPAAQIRAFALLRTMGTIHRVERLLEPCRGQITWVAGDARRIP
jgi:hypothetical protein